jgi:hypothetical protein
MSPIESRKLNSGVALVVVLGVLVATFAGFFVGRYGQGGATVSTSTSTHSTPTYSICKNTVGTGCPHLITQTFNLTIRYNGPWGATYYVYLGLGVLGPPVETGSFYGAKPATETIFASGVDIYGITTCLVAQKLDGSNSTLAITTPNSSLGNETSIPFGSTRFCVAYAAF